MEAWQGAGRHAGPLSACPWRGQTGQAPLAGAPAGVPDACPLLLGKDTWRKALLPSTPVNCLPAGPFPSAEAAARQSRIFLQRTAAPEAASDAGRTAAGGETAPSARRGQGTPSPRQGTGTGLHRGQGKLSGMTTGRGQEHRHACGPGGRLAGKRGGGPPAEPQALPCLTRMEPSAGPGLQGGAPAAGRRRRRLPRAASCPTQGRRHPPPEACRRAAGRFSVKNKVRLRRR